MRVAFGIGVALAGLAGALLAPLFMVFPTNGADDDGEGLRDHRHRRPGLDSRARSIGGLLLGLVESLGAAFIASPYQNVYGFSSCC